MTQLLLVVGLLGGGFWWLANQQEGKRELPSHQTPVKLHQLNQLPDPDSRLTFPEVLQLPMSQWRQVSAINFGYMGGTGWANLSIYSPENQNVILELQNHFIDSVKVWLVTDTGLANEYPITGFLQLSESQHNPLLHRYFGFELPLEAGRSYRILIRGTTTPGFTMKYPVRFWDQTEFIQNLRESDWGWALFVGIVLFVIFISLTGYIILRKLIYLYYAGYVASLSLYAMVNDGWGIFLPYYSHQLFNPINIGHFLNLGICFLLLFSRKFLVIPRQASSWWLRISPWWLWLVITLCIFVTNYGYSNQSGFITRSGYWLGMSVAFAAGILWLSYLIYALQKGFQPAWLLLASQVVIILFFGTNIFLVNLNAVMLAFPDMLIFRVALTTELLIIAIGWVYRQKVVAESREQLQAINVEQQKAVWEAERIYQELQIKTLRMENELHGQRERLARDLHDGIGSQLTHIISRLDLLVYSHTPQQKQLLRLRDFTRDTNQNLRETIWILHQKVITCNEFSMRLHSFLRNLWEEQENPVLTWQCPTLANNPVLPPLVAMHLFRITQEAIANSIKYANASKINVLLEYRFPEIVLTVEDNGSGFSTEAGSFGFGLGNMRKRAEEMSGTLVLKTGSCGTRIRVSVPISN